MLPREDLVLIHGKIAHSLSRNELQAFSKAYLCFSRTTGSILFLEEDIGQNYIGDHSFGQIIELTSKQFLIPGFIDTHFHAPQYSFMGNGGDLKVMDWVEEYTFPAEAKYQNIEFARTVYSKVVQWQLENGKTYCSYFATIHPEATKLLADECITRGQRALIGKVCMDKNAPEQCYQQLKACLETAEEVIQYILNKLNDPGTNKLNLLVRIVVTPRYAGGCTMQLMKGLAQLAERYDIPIQTHLSEEKSQIEFVTALFPQNTSYANIYESAGLMGKTAPKTKNRAILAHCVHLTKEERQILKKYDGGISHCANSNISLASGLLPTKELMDVGIKMSLGTDVSGGCSVSILDAMRSAMNISKVLSLRKPQSRLTLSEIFFLATLGGAEVLSSEGHVGNFVSGKQFDGLIVSLEGDGFQHVDVFNEDPRSNQLTCLLEKFIFSGDDRSIIKVFVNGREVHTRK